ncbi:immunity 42 family protein [uncultured Ruminococcus sp.]|uniref:immunity 42 family protein n=1 Tax=uncultured Ruminococcus sp. TaxID=165186 RepID=UPI0025E1FC3B|nr:immunity 42 family protein [uncultured Ruminococcus sp.]
MVIGESKYYDFGFILERIPEWEDDSFKNGIMFLMINGAIYPKSARTTTFNCELPDLLSKKSAMISPVVDRELFRLDSETLFEKLADITYGRERDALYDMRYMIPFHEINDARFSVFIVSDGEEVRLLVGKDREVELILDNEIKLNKEKYMKVINKLKEFYETLK